MRFWVAAIGGCCLFAGNSLAGPNQFGDEAMVEVVTSYRPLINDQNPNSKEDVVRYERDAKYMAIKRHLLPEYPRQKRVASKQKVTAESMQVRDKPLVLGSRGLEIKGFERLSYVKLEFDYYHHLQKHYPIPAPNIPDEIIDTQAEVAKHTKEYIYHPARLALNRLRKVDMQELEPPEAPVSLEKIPETQLRLPRTRPTQLILHRSDKTLDLLTGNESVNRSAYQKW